MHPFSALLGIFVTVLLLVPALATATFRYYWTDFAPSMEFEPAAALVASAAAVTAFLVWGHAAIRRVRGASPTPSIVGVLEAVAIVLLVPCACGGLWYSAMGGPIAYALHQNSLPTSANLFLNVAHAKHIGRTSCRYRAVLENDSFFFQRRLCGISKEQYVLLERGGNIEVVATSSDYGILVSHYDQAAPR